MEATDGLVARGRFHCLVTGEMLYVGGLARLPGVPPMLCYLGRVPSSPGIPVPVFCVRVHWDRGEASCQCEGGGGQRMSRYFWVRQGGPPCGCLLSLATFLLSVFVHPSLLLGALGCLPLLMAVEGQTSGPQLLDASLQ